MHLLTKYECGTPAFYRRRAIYNPIRVHFVPAGARVTNLILRRNESATRHMMTEFFTPNGWLHWDIKVELCSPTKTLVA